MPGKWVFRIVLNGVMGGPLLYRTFFFKIKRGFITLLIGVVSPLITVFFWAHFVVNIESPFPNPKVGEGEQWHEAFGSCHREVGGG